MGGAGTGGGGGPNSAGDGGGGGGVNRMGGGGGMNNVLEACERIKDEYNFLQAQLQNLKVEFDKLVQEKTEMQRHYVMVSCGQEMTSQSVGTQCSVVNVDLSVCSSTTKCPTASTWKCTSRRRSPNE